jgi:hypothetical protein
MKTINATNASIICSSDSTGRWDAVYASQKRLVDRYPITAWALVGVVEPGRKCPTPEIHGVFSAIDNVFSLAGWERNFLGYCRHDENACELYGGAARALLKKLAKRSKSSKGAGKP